MAKKKKKGQPEEPAKPRKSYYTKEEEDRMFLACWSAAKFMQKYGKGRKPYSIDREHYLYKEPTNGKKKDKDDR